MLTCLFVSGVLSAACGGEADGTTSTITKKQFVKKAEAICEDARSKALASAGANPVQEGVVPAIESAAAGLGALGAPSGDEEQVGELVQALVEDAARVKQVNARTLPAFEREFKDSAEIARTYGIPACAYA